MAVTKKKRKKTPCHFTCTRECPPPASQPLPGLEPAAPRTGEHSTGASHRVGCCVTSRAAATDPARAREGEGGTSRGARRPRPSGEGGLRARGAWPSRGEGSRRQRNEARAAAECPLPHVRGRRWSLRRGGGTHRPEAERGCRAAMFASAAGRARPWSRSASAGRSIPPVRRAL